MHSKTKRESLLGFALFFVSLLLPISGAAQDCIDYGDYIATFKMTLIK